MQDLEPEVKGGNGCKSDKNFGNFKQHDDDSACLLSMCTKEKKNRILINENVWSTL